MCLLIYLHLFYQSGVNKRSWIFALLPSTCSLQSMVNIINSFSLIVISFISSLLHKSTDSGFWYVTVEFLISSRMLPKFFFLPNFHHITIVRLLCFKWTILTCFYLEYVLPACLMLRALILVLFSIDRNVPLEQVLEKLSRFKPRIVCH